MFKQLLSFLGSHPFSININFTVGFNSQQEYIEQLPDAVGEPIGFARYLEESETGEEDEDY